MKRKGLIFVFVCLAIVGCHQGSQLAEQFRYHDNGTAKPSVALVSVFDHSKHHLNWNLSEEFTEGIRGNLVKSSAFFLSSDFEMLSSQSISLLEINPFFEDMRWLSEANTDTEFVVFAEIIQHTLRPVQAPGFFAKTFTNPHELNMAVRVRVIDLRKGSPRVILQEIFQETKTLSWKPSSNTYHQGGFAKTAFFLTPLGRAHSKMIAEISQQIHDYILLAKVN